MAGDTALSGGVGKTVHSISRLCLSGIVAAFSFGIAPQAHAATASEPAAVAHRLWSALLTRCGESYFYAGSVFDRSGMLSDVQVGHQKTLEFKGVHFNSVPIRVTDAERANGIAYRIRITMIAHLYREGDDAWQDGPASRPRNTDDIIARALGSANSDMFDMGGNGAMALQLVKYKGMWAVTRSSVDSTSTIGFGSKFFEVDKIIAAKVARYSCAKGEVVAPDQQPTETQSPP